MPTIDTIPITEFNEQWIEDSFGNEIEGVGDINKDGFNDFIITSLINFSNYKGYAYLFWGGDTISWKRSETFTSDTLFDFFGASAANIGDINKDGFDDIAISAIGTPDLDTGRVYIYYGGSSMDTIKDTTLYSGNSELAFGVIIKNTGDINNDGTVDFLVLAGESKIYFYLSMDTIKIFDGSKFGYGGYVNIETNCDINNDGISDFVIGNTNYKNSDSVMVGGSFIFIDKANNNLESKYKVGGENKWDEFSKIMSHADINGDGYDELIILAPSYPDYNNPTGKLYIYSYKKITALKEDNKSIPNDFNLYQNYPNPFNPSTVISYQLSVTSNIQLKVCDILGREITTLIDKEIPAGKHEIEFDASKFNLSSGIYFYQLRANGFVSTKKLVLLK